MLPRTRFQQSGLRGVLSFPLQCPSNQSEPSETGGLLRENPWQGSILLESPDPVPCVCDSTCDLLATISLLFYQHLGIWDVFSSLSLIKTWQLEIYSWLRLYWKTLGESQNYTCSMTHETFHLYCFHIAHPKNVDSVFKGKFLISFDSEQIWW